MSRRCLNFCDTEHLKILEVLKKIFSYFIDMEYQKIYIKRYMQISKGINKGINKEEQVISILCIYLSIIISLTKFQNFFHKLFFS